MTASDPSPLEPKSPFVDLRTNSRKFERRASVILGLTIVSLLLGICTPNAIFAYRIRRIVDNGGYVRSRSEYFGEAAMRHLGWRIADFYENHYVIREYYDVFLGDRGRAFEPCGAGISLAEISDDEVDRDPGDEGPKMARALGRIQKLSLAETSVTDQGLAPLAGMTSIKELDLSSTKVNGPGLANLQGMDLEVFYIHSTAVGDDGLALLPHIPNLKRLDIGETRVTSAFLSRLSSYSKLEDLNLAGLPVTDEIVQQLTKLSLWRLDLRNTSITDASIPHLEKMTLLVDLNLCGTKVTLAKALASKNSAVHSWATTRDLVWAPGACTAH